MNDMREKLSALMDGSLKRSEAEEVLSALDRHPELLEEWSRYHLIGDALKNNLPTHIDLQLNERVKAELANAPPLKSQSSFAQDILIKLRGYFSPPQFVSVGAFAATTFVAVLVGVMIGASPPSDHSLEEHMTVATQQAPHAVTSTNNLVTLEVAPFTAGGSAQVVVVEHSQNPVVPHMEQKVWEPKLNGYLNSHSEFSTSPSMYGNNVLPMVRLVGHGSSQ